MEKILQNLHPELKETQLLHKKSLVVQDITETFLRDTAVRANKEDPNSVPNEL